MVGRSRFPSDPTCSSSSRGKPGLEAFDPFSERGVGSHPKVVLGRCTQGRDRNLGDHASPQPLRDGLELGPNKLKRVQGPGTPVLLQRRNGTEGPPGCWG